MKATGCDLLARSLIKSGVRFVAGREAGALGPAFSALRAEAGVSAISPRGDIAGPFMAYGNTFYRGLPGVVLASTPAEAVNAVAGVGTAWGDKIPVFVITVRPESRVVGNVAGRTHGRVFSAFAKWSESVDRWEDIPRMVGQACREALGGCPGPVHLDVPERLLGEAREVTQEELAGLVEAGLGTLRHPAIEGDPELVLKALRTLAAAERPLIVSGGGVVHARAWEEMDGLVRALRIPASTSMAGEGTVYGDNPCFIGGPSYVGGESFHRAIRRADCVLVVGAALGGLEGFGNPPLWNGDIRFIQVDIDPVRICLNISVEISILGDAGAVLRQLLGLVEAGAVKPNPAHRPWLEHLLMVGRRFRSRVEAELDMDWPVIQPGQLARTVRELADPDTFMVIDGGNTSLWASMFCLSHRPLSAIFPAGLGTLGCGIPTAIGVKAADPQRPLVVLQGDGSFLYNVQELETARRLGMDFVVVIFNDGFWNMIKMGQDMAFGGRRVGSELGDIDYAAVARGFGCYGRRVEKAADIAPAFREARASGLPAVLDVRVDPDALPEAGIGFLMAEFDGIPLNPLRALGIPRVKMDRRLLNRAKSAVNIILDKDLA